MNRIAEVSTRQAARIAGVGLLVMAVLALFANFFVLEELIVPGNAAATATNITDSEGIFRVGLASFLVVIVLDVVVAWALYIYFQTVNRELSVLAAWLRLMFAAIFGVALASLFSALQLVSGAGYLRAFETPQLNAQVMSSIDAFNFVWLVALVSFGIHLVVLGYLILRSGFVPKVIGFLLILAGSAYVVDTLANALLSNYEDYETALLLFVAVPAVIGEVAFAVWLLARGGKAQKALA